MKTLVKNGFVYLNGKFERCDILVENGIVSSFSPDYSNLSINETVDADGCFVFPGLTDVHVHLREPGFIYKETVASGTRAAAHGGFTHVCSMPNLDPVPDSLENLSIQLEAIKKDACIYVHPYGAITVGEKGEKLSEMEEMSGHVVAFSDDGRGVQSEEMMIEAMLKAKKLGKVVVAHCEVNELLNGGYIHDGEYARIHSHRGICSESEWKMIERDIALAKKTGVRYHVCHISTKESVELIRQAKNDGIAITCETAPHYLVFNDMDLEENARFKMNPPIRSESDRLALVEGVCDGTIDVIATDHAPHSFDEKSKGLEKSLMGVVGLETSFAVMYTHFVKKGIFSMEHLMRLMHDNAMKIFGIGSNIEIGKKADFTIFDVGEKYKVNPDEFLSKGKFTPFEGCELYGKCKLTLVGENKAFFDSGKGENI